MTTDCGHECFVIGGPWIAEDPMCPVHGVQAQKRERHEAERLANPKARIADALATVQAARVEANEALTEMLKAAVLEIAAKYPGHVVTGLAAMGSWFIVVEGVHFDENMEHEEPGGPGVRDIMFGATGALNRDREHPVFDAFDTVWDELKTYPTVRFDVDETGKLTSRTDW